MRRLVPLVLLCCLASVSSPAKWINVADEWPGLTSQQKQWFKDQRTDGSACCDTADGHSTTWDIRQGQYWAFWDGGWHPIPDSKVIKHSSAVDVAVLWLTAGHEFVDGKDLGYRAVRCFVPGPGA